MNMSSDFLDSFQSTDGLTEALVNKWAGYVPCDHKHAKFIATMLETQRRYFDTNHSTKSVVQLREALGEQWDEAFLHAYSKTLQDSPIFDMVACQPMTGPIGKLAFLLMADPAVSRLANAYTSDEESAEIPEIRLDVKTEEVAARQTNTKGIVSLTALKDALGIGVSADALLKTVLDEVINGELQNLIAMARNTALENDYVETVAVRALPDEVTLACIRAGNQIHRRTMRGPGNRLVTNPKNETKVVGVKDRAIVHVDPFYPESDVVMWRQGPSILDGTIIWAPYVIDFIADEIEVPDAEQNNDEVEKQKILRITFRRGVKMVDEVGCHLVKFVAE